MRILTNAVPINEKKEAMKLKESGNEYMEGLKGIKRKKICE